MRNKIFSLKKLSKIIEKEKREKQKNNTMPWSI